MKKVVGIILIIVGGFIAFYFFTLGWAVVGGVGLGLVWGGISMMREKNFQIVEEGIVADENGGAYLQVKVQNLSSRLGEIFITANIYYQNQVITTVTSNTLSVPPQEIGTLTAYIPLNQVTVEITQLTHKIVNSKIR